MYMNMHSAYIRSFDALIYCNHAIKYMTVYCTEMHDCVNKCQEMFIKKVNAYYRDKITSFREKY